MRPRRRGKTCSVGPTYLLAAMHLRWYHCVMVEDSHPMTIRLPSALYEELRRAAYERHAPMNEIVTEAVHEHLAGYFARQREGPGET